MSAEGAPLFSVAMPAYNAEPTIARAIESVFSQTFADWELVVVDDGSTDGTAAVVAGFVERDARVKLVQQENAGCGAARDTAVRASSGRYILRLDGDDYLLPEYMQRMSAFMHRCAGYDIYSCNGYHIYPDGTRRLARPGERYEAERSFTFEEMLEATHIFTVAVFSRELFDRVAGIRPDVYCEDLDFWLRALVAGATHRYTPQALAVYEVSELQMTADVQRTLTSRIAIYQSLIDSNMLSESRVQAAEAAIERTRTDLLIYKRRTAVHEGVTAVFGTRAGEAVSRAMHSTSRYLRPAAARLLAPFTRRSNAR